MAHPRLLRIPWALGEGRGLGLSVAEGTDVARSHSLTTVWRTPAFNPSDDVCQGLSQRRQQAEAHVRTRHL